MDKRQICGEIIVDEKNVVGVVQQHEECIPTIKEELKKLTKLNWAIIILLAVTMGEKAIQWVRI